MATVEFRYDPKNTAWFTANAAMVLKAGEPAYHDTTGLFKLGDGVTALSALSFLPTVSASTPTIQQVLTAGQVATTTIETTGFIKTGGLSTQFLKADGTVDSTVYGVGNALTSNPLSQFAATTSSQLAGVISDETGTGALVFGTSPTFTTSIITPNVTGVSGNLTLTNAIQSSGAITQFTFTNVANTNQTATTNIPNFKVTGANKQWATGTVPLQYFTHLTANTVSAVGASTFTNVYSLFVESSISGTNSTITNNYALGTNGNVIFDNGTSKMIWRAVPSVATWSGIFLNVTPSTTNYTVLGDGSGLTALNGTLSSRLQVGASDVVRANFASIQNTPNDGGTSSTTLYSINPTTQTGGTGSTEISTFSIGSYIRTWGLGNITTQRWAWLKTPTVAFVSAYTVTNSYGLYVEAATAGTNATITNNYAAGFSGNVNVIGSLYSTGFRLVDGTQGLNKVLVSDANGNASWATSSAGYARSFNNIAINTTGAAAANTDYYYFCTATLTFTLPTAVGNTNTYYIKVTSGTLTINTTSSQTIDGSLTITTSVANTAFTLISDGTNWQII